MTNNTVNSFIGFIEKHYGLTVELIIEDDPCLLPDYMTVKIAIKDSHTHGGSSLAYTFITDRITEQAMKNKIMDMVNTVEAFKRDGKPILLANHIGGSCSFCDYRDQIKKVIFNDPATIVLWKDGSKTVVKCKPGDKYDKTIGFAMACSKYFFGNKGNYQKVFKKYVKEAW